MTMREARRLYRAVSDIMLGGAHGFRRWARGMAPTWAANGARPTGKLERIWKGPTSASGTVRR